MSGFVFKHWVRVYTCGFLLHINISGISDAWIRVRTMAFRLRDLAWPPCTLLTSQNIHKHLDKRTERAVTKYPSTSGLIERVIKYESLMELGRLLGCTVYCVCARVSASVISGEISIIDISINPVDIRNLIDTTYRSDKRFIDRCTLIYVFIKLHFCNLSWFLILPDTNCSMTEMIGYPCHSMYIVALTCAYRSIDWLTVYLFVGIMSNPVKITKLIFDNWFCIRVVCIQKQKGKEMENH